MDDGEQQMTTQKKLSKGVTLSIEVYRFFQNVYPDFYSKSWLGEGNHDKYVDSFIDHVIKKLNK